MALAGKNAKVAAYSNPIAMTEEATTTTDDIRYQITDTNKRVLCPYCDVTVLDGGIATTEDYTFDRLSGNVTFLVAASRDITITGQYLTYSDIACAYEYEFAITSNNTEANCFTEQYVKREQTLLDFSSSLTKFYNVSNYFIEILDQDIDLLLEFYSDYNNDPELRAWVKISSDSISASVDGLVEETIDFEGWNDIDKHCVSFGPF